MMFNSTMWIQVFSTDRLSYLQRILESECTVIEIPNAGHFLFYDEPNYYAAALASFARNSCLFLLRREPD
jgi:pimeloyl-ACP methyl ester carboxylesterase